MGELLLKIRKYGKMQRFKDTKNRSSWSKKSTNVVPHSLVKKRLPLESEKMFVPFINKPEHLWIAWPWPRNWRGKRNEPLDLMKFRMRIPWTLKSPPAPLRRRIKPLRKTSKPTFKPRLRGSIKKSVPPAL